MGLDERRYFTLGELAHISGLSEVTLRRYWRDGKIPGFQPGGEGSRVLFPHDALERTPLPPSASLEPQPIAPDADQFVPHPSTVPGKPPARRRSRARWRQGLPIKQGQDQQKT